jgi:hypothetical protein
MDPNPSSTFLVDIFKDYLLMQLIGLNQKALQATGQIW